jgi:hypothetical protein
MRLLLLHGFERSHCLVHEVMKSDPNNYGKDETKPQSDPQSNQSRLLPPFDGGDDRCAAMRTRPRMVAYLSAAFVAFDQGHILILESRNAKRVKFLHQINE